MSKKGTYYNEAERLYAEDQMTINEISSKLNVAVRTVNYWKKGKSWDDKREKFLNGKRTFHERLYDFSQTLMDAIENDIKSGEKLDAGRLYTFTRILPLITKIKDYEDVINKLRQPNKKNKSLSPEIIRQIEEEILGIHRKPENTQNP